MKPEMPLQEKTPVLASVIGDVKVIIEDIRSLNYSIKLKLEYIQVTPEKLNKTTDDLNVPTEASVVGQLTEIKNTLMEIRKISIMNDDKLKDLLGN